MRINTQAQFSFWSSSRLVLFSCNTRIRLDYLSFKSDTAYCAFKCCTAITSGITRCKRCRFVSKHFPERARVHYGQRWATEKVKSNKMEKGKREKETEKSKKGMLCKSERGREISSDAKIWQSITLTAACSLSKSTSHYSSHFSWSVKERSVYMTAVWSLSGETTDSCPLSQRKQ